MQNIDKPVALIVGGSTGMGKDIARRLVAEGLTVLLLARDPKTLAEAQADLGPGSIETVELDLFEEAAVDYFIGKLDAEPRHIKYLVNSAGSFKPTPFLEHTKPRTVV